MNNVASKLEGIVPSRGASAALASILRDEIKSGRYRAGERLTTLRELSSLTKLGYSTVNRAISTLVREGLLEARKGAGTFVVDQSGSAMKNANKEQLKVFALVIPETKPGIYASLQHGFCEAAAELHYQVIVCDTGESSIKQSDALMQLIDQSVAGIAVVSVPGSRSYQLRVVQNANIPVVQLNRRVEDVSAPLISLSFSDLGGMAARVLANNGHQHILMLGSHRGEVATQYEVGFRSTYKRLRLTPKFETCFSNYPNPNWREEMRQRIDEALSRPDRPTAFFAMFDDVAEMIYLAATARGLEIPKDFSLISFGGSPRSGVLGGLISTVTGDEVWAGRQAISLLGKMSAGTRDILSDEEFDVPLKLCEGETVGKLNSPVVEINPELELISHDPT
jgi:DNA-binding LacI/PurR family transcriptional regulator